MILKLHYFVTSPSSPCSVYIKHSSPRCGEGTKTWSQAILACSALGSSQLLLPAKNDVYFPRLLGKDWIKSAYVKDIAKYLALSKCSLFPPDKWGKCFQYSVADKLSLIRTHKLLSFFFFNTIFHLSPKHISRYHGMQQEIETYWTNNMWNNAVTHTYKIAAWLHKRINIQTFKKRLYIGISYFNQAKTNL